MFSKKLISILLLVVLLIYKCSSSLYNPTISDARRSGNSIDLLIAGRKTYITSCGSCHSLYLPEQYTKTEWRVTLDSMQKRAKITEDEKNIILQYLLSKSKE